MSSGKKHKKSGGRDAPAISECKAFLGALEAFLGDRLAVESGAVLAAAVDAAAEARGLNAAFDAVLQTGAVGMSDALHLALFLHGADALAEEAGDPPLGPFSADEAFAAVARVYDRGYLALCEEAFDEGSDDESEASGDDAERK